MKPWGRAGRLVRPIDLERDHVLGAPTADLTLVEYGSYACEYCHAAHEVIKNLKGRFGGRLRYVYRHLPLTDREVATRAAELAEYASLADGRFWDVHSALMERDPQFTAEDIDRLAEEMGIPPRAERAEAITKAARTIVRDDARSGLASGARMTPTFFINGRRYEGPWDEASLSEAILGSVGHRLRAATVDFARWAPSSGLLLLLGTVLALIISNSVAGIGFQQFWGSPLGVSLGGRAFTLSVLDWLNHGLLSVFFLVVGLEIKRELTIGRLATRREAMLPLVAALGGMAMPALIYLVLAPPGPLAVGWGVVIATDTAFAIALILLLGDRVPVELRVFLTAAVIVDDLVAIALVALVYTDTVAMGYLVAAAVVVGVLVAVNRSSIYRALPYAVLGVLLWLCLHEAGVHATLAGVILALVTPTRPPPNLRALMVQAQMVLQMDRLRSGDAFLSHGPSASALGALDTIHGRIESPASKLLRTIEPWSSYLVLPVFALANAGLAWSLGIFEGHGRLILAIVLGLVVGKPLGIVAAAWMAVRLKLAEKPEAYSWGQLTGAGALAGIGFTMSLLIAGEAYPDAGDFTAAKAAIFLASLAAGAVGVAILWRQPAETEDLPRL